MSGEMGPVRFSRITTLVMTSLVGSLALLLLSSVSDAGLFGIKCMTYRYNVGGSPPTIYRTTIYERQVSYRKAEAIRTSREWAATSLFTTGFRIELDLLDSEEVSRMELRDRRGRRRLYPSAAKSTVRLRLGLTSERACFRAAAVAAQGV
jgi:hypothetical protein